MRISDWSSDVCSSDLYDPERGALVIARARAFLDEAVPLAGGSWTDLSGPDGIVLKNPAQYVGKTHKSRLFKHNGLHIDVLFDSAHPIGKNDRAGIADVMLAAAITTIADLEDSVAAVDAEEIGRAAGRERGGQ